MDPAMAKGQAVVGSGVVFVVRALFRLEGESADEGKRCDLFDSRDGSSNPARYADGWRSRVSF